MLNRRHVLHGCRELVSFLCAEEEIGSGGGADEDEFGRSERSRTVVVINGLGVGGAISLGREEKPRSVSNASAGADASAEKEDGGGREDDRGEEEKEEDEEGEAKEGGKTKKERKREKKEQRKAEKKAKEAEESGHSKQVSARTMAFDAAMNASIHQRLKTISSRDVQEGVFNLAKELLSLDKATFLRGRMISVIRGIVNFLTGGSTLHKTLYNLHSAYVTGSNVSGGVKWLRELLWPLGEFAEAAPELTELEKDALADKVFKTLLRLVPESLTSVVGEDLAGEGVHLLFDLLQNETILKSISYQLVDAIVLELYPELQIDLDGLHAVED